MVGMSAVVLVTDFDTPLGGELARRLRAAGNTVVATRSGSEKKEAPAAQEESLLILDWNRKSPISTRNVILTALNRFDRIDEALVLEVPGVERKLLHETSYQSIEAAVDQWVKGSLFLIKELLEVFQRARAGVLALVHYSQPEAGGVFPPLEAALRGSFQALAQSLFSSYNQEYLYLNGFESTSSQCQEFAEFLLGTLNERGRRVSGKWFRFQLKTGLLSALKSFR